MSIQELTSWKFFPFREQVSTAMASCHRLGWLFFTFLLSVRFPSSFALSGNSTRPEMTIPQGILLGTTLTTRLGRNVSAFLGIPYGEPPIGNLRFANPVKADGWNGTLNASEDPSRCPQIPKDEIVGDEDCLYVKVYTPQIFQDTNPSLLPVMVYVHGGGFAAEFPAQNGPGYLLDADVVLVTLNYRLGPLGFLSTGDEVAAGNWGLKDQVLALEWVQDNIKYFGGDPDQVTIFGESAGAASVHLLTLSNATIGLFHRYITQSGSALAKWAYRSRTAYSSRAFEFGDYVGCSNGTSETLISCLRRIDFSDMVTKNAKFVDGESLPSIVWGPTDEPEIDGAILTDNPANLIAAGKIRDLPWMTGTVGDEGLIYTAELYENEETFYEFMEHIDTLLPRVLCWLDESDAGAARIASAKSYYFNDDPTSNSSELLKNLTILVGDSHFYYPAYNALRQHHAFAVNQQYFYTFKYQGTYSFSHFYECTAMNCGVAHADDLIYLFPRESLFSDQNKTMSETDYQMVDTMVQLWTSFATNGTPSASALNGGTTWAPYSTADNYFRIGNESDPALEVQNCFFPDRMQFWADLDAAVETKSNDSGSATSTPNLLFLLLVSSLKLFLSAATADTF